MVKKLVFVVFLTAILSFYFFFYGVSKTYPIEINHEKAWEEMSDVPDILRDRLFGAKNKADFIKTVKKKMKKSGIDLTNISGSGLKEAEAEKVDLSEHIKMLKEDGFHVETWNEFKKHYPEGVFDFIPLYVISDGGVTQYEILPEMAGISQLIVKGSLEQISDKEFRILKDIPSFPAGLSGGRNGVRFLIAPNVEISADLKSFCVVKEGTDEILSHESACQ